MVKEEIEELQKMQIMTDWVQSHGGCCSPSLEFKISKDTGSTAYAKSEIAVGGEIKSSRLLACPISLVIDYPKAASLIWGSVEECPFAEQPEVAIRLFLCRERILGNESVWAPYINILPTSFDTPLYFTDAELALLAGTNIYGDVDLRRAAWEEEWKNAVSFVPNSAMIPAKLYTWELYLWACTVLSSRSFPSKLVLKTEGLSYPVLVPLVDSLNHRPLTPVYWGDLDNTFSIYAAQTIEAGHEVFNNYGPKGNEELLMGYGFCLEDNKFDVVSLKIRRTALAPDKESLLEAMGITNDVFYLSDTEPLPENLLNMFRVQFANEPEIEIMRHSLYDSSRLQSTTRCDISALGRLNIAISMKISQHKAPRRAPTTRREKSIFYYVTRQLEILRTTQRVIYETLYSLVKPADVQVNESGELVKDIHRYMNTVGFSLASVLADARFEPFITSIDSVFGSSDAVDLRESDAEDQILVLFVAHLLLTTLDVSSPCSAWLTTMKSRYNIDGFDMDSDLFEDFENMREQIIPPLAEHNAEVFAMEKWTSRVLAWAATVVDSEGVVVSVDTESTPEYWIVTTL
ncbi:uncharacterized protein V1518DRAFT_312045 [Limtongia smithiae]|uniref:uncharacterized protein n=1 Tax=Limtongia smithiae TaxID=1125753 RepID=UPI0034CF5981